MPDYCHHDYWWCAARRRWLRIDKLSRARWAGQCCANWYTLPWPRRTRLPLYTALLYRSNTRQYNDIDIEHHSATLRRAMSTAESLLLLEAMSRGARSHENKEIALLLLIGEWSRCAFARFSNYDDTTPTASLLHEMPRASPRGLEQTRSRFIELPVSRDLWFLMPDLEGESGCLISNIHDILRFMPSTDAAAERWWWRQKAAASTRNQFSLASSTSSVYHATLLSSHHNLRRYNEALPTRRSLIFGTNHIILLATTMQMMIDVWDAINKARRSWIPAENRFIEETRRTAFFIDIYFT